MTLKAIEVEGFGPYTHRQRIPIRPLTLIFGPNSAGKTSLFRAIHHAQHCLLRGESPGRYSDLSGSFDLLEPEKRYNAEFLKLGRGHRVRFVCEYESDEPTSALSLLKAHQSALGRYLDPYIEVYTLPEYEVYAPVAAYRKDVISFEFGFDQIPVVMASYPYFVIPRYKLNFAHPFLQADTMLQMHTNETPCGSKTGAEVQSPDNEIKQLFAKINLDRSGFGLLDRCMPELRDAYQECYLNASPMAESENDPRSKPDAAGGLLIPTDDVLSFLRNHEINESDGEMRLLYVRDDKEWHELLPDHGDFAALLYRPDMRTSTILFAGVVAPDRDSLEKIRCKDPKSPYRQNRYVDVRSLMLHLKSHQSQGAHFGYGHDRFTNDFFMCSSYSRKVGLEWSAEQLSQMTRASDEFHPFLSVQQLRYGSRDERDPDEWNKENRFRPYDWSVDTKLVEELGERLQEQIRGIYSEVSAHLDDLIHIGPLRQIPEMSQSVADSDWYTGRAAWVPYRGNDEDRLPLINRCFSEIGINYELLIHRHRDPQRLVDWLQKRPTSPLKWGFYPEKPDLERLRDLISGTALKDFAELISLWNKYNQFRMDDPYERYKVSPSPFEVSPLDRFVLYEIRPGADDSRANDREAIEPSQVGEGVRQVLPLIRAVSQGDNTSGCLIFQQPELHLHPRMQVGLTDTLMKHGPCKILETHSEHIILRVLKRVRETANGIHSEGDLAIHPEDISVVYLKAAQLQESPASHSMPGGATACRLRISAEGDFIDPWPHGFFEERLEDLFDDQEPQQP